MYEIERVVGNSHVGADGNLTLGAAVDFMQDCCGFQLDHEQELTEYFRAKNITMFLISRQVNFHQPVHYGESVKIATTIYQLKNTYGFRNTNICDMDGNLKISSYAGGAFIDLTQMKATTIPKAVTDTVSMGEKFAGMEYLPRKIRLPKDTSPETMPGVPICKAHIDINRHMNNAQYYRIAEEYLPEDFTIRTARCEYKTPAKRGDVLVPQVYRCADERYMVSLQNAAGEVFANVEFR